MCSFTVTNTTNDLSLGNTFSKRRGPDHTQIKQVNGIQFLMDSGNIAQANFKIYGIK